jgi:hypothetical protein
MVIEIQNKEIENLLYEAKQTIRDIKENKVSDAYQFLEELKKELK